MEQAQHPSMDDVRARTRALLDELRASRYPGALWPQAVDLIARLATRPSSGLRPGLVLRGFEAYGGADGAVAVEFASGVELYHLFMLIYDDVIDEASIRRGLPTVHRALRQHVDNGRAGQLALILASVLQNRASRVMVGADPTGAAALRILDAGLHAGVAEFHDLLGWPGSQLGAKAATRFFADKGGGHSVTAPLVAGILLARPDADVRPAERWGLHAGLAFQAIDDLGDIVALPHEVGKDVLQDILQGRLSLVTHLLTDALGHDVAVDLCRGAATPTGRREFFHRLSEERIVERGCAFVRDQLGQADAVADLPDALRAGLANVRAKLGRSLDRLERRVDDGWLHTHHSEHPGRN